MTIKRKNFYLIGRWVLLLTILCSVIIIPSSFRWYNTYLKSNSYVLSKVLVDSIDVISDDGASPMITGYSKELNNIPIYIDDPQFFLSKEDRVFDVWHSVKSKYAYLARMEEKKFPKNSYLYKLLLFYIPLIIALMWGILGFKYYYKHG